MYKNMRMKQEFDSLQRCNNEGARGDLTTRNTVSFTQLKHDTHTSQKKHLFDDRFTPIHYT